MKMLRFLVAVALVFGAGSEAKAAGFQMVVLDPSFTPTLITNDSLVFSFSPCQPGQLPAGDTYTGCFTGENDTGSVLTTLDLNIPTIPGVTPGCNLVAGELFTSATCGDNAQGYYVIFGGGDIQSLGYDCDHDGDGGSKINSDDVGCTIFTIAENGVPTTAFPEVSGTINAPEPSPIWLLSTGVLMSGVFFGDWRRRVLCGSRL